MTDASADWDRWDREQRLPSVPSCPAPPQPHLFGPSSSRHQPDEVAAETAPAGAGVAAQLERSRQLRPGWRWSPEQKRLRALLRAQRKVGAELAALEHVGARILHARRLPTSAQPVDHIVVTSGSTFVVVDIVSSRDQPVSWTPDGHLRVGGSGTLQRLQEAVADGAALIGEAAASVLPNDWVVSITPALAVVGPWPYPLSHTTHLNVGDPAALRQWMGGPFFPPRLDPVDVAVMANAVARACPSAV